ncbi:MAG: anthranilate synthase component I [Gammaproteobacteria bacterium]|nr:anthranilate synthase component I [Gammaproteobacteria bacterium]
MTFEQFEALHASGYNRIPLMRVVLADMDTPLSAYLKLANQPFSYLLESVQGGEKWGRYSIIGLPARCRLEISGSECREIVDGTTVRSERVSDPLAEVVAYRARFKVAERPDLPRFNGGLVGYFGYDTVRYVEPKLAHCPNPETIETPDICLLLSDEVVVFDNLAGKLYLLIYADPTATATPRQAWELARIRLDALVEGLQCQLPELPQSAPTQVRESDFISGFGRDGFEQGVKRIKAYIRDGDAMQVVLSQRMALPFSAPPLNLYRALRSLNPSPYMFYFDMGDYQIVGSSPEILVRLEDDEVTVRPIAGTRPRGATEVDDRALEADLLADPKELAEHLMLIDLGRNDVGRVAQVGSVELTEQMVVERYSHVMHIVSNVEGRLTDGLNALDVLRAALPAGTVSGAPKIRAMQIIDELEPVKRGIYAGAVGYLGWNGNMDTAIAIRTAVVKDKTLYIQVGAGIVADSVPASEWEETLNKGRAIFRAAELASNGLRAEE